VGGDQDIEGDRQRRAQDILAEKILRAEFEAGIPDGAGGAVDSGDVTLGEVSPEGIDSFALRTAPIENRQTIRPDLIFQP